MLLRVAVCVTGMNGGEGERKGKKEKKRGEGQALGTMIQYLGILLTQQAWKATVDFPPRSFFRFFSLFALSSLNALQPSTMIGQENL